MAKNNLGNKETMAKNIKKYMEKRGITAARLAADIDVPPTTISNWMRGVTYPRIDKIEMMANYFGISKAELVEDFDDIDTTSIASAVARQKKIEMLNTEMIIELDNFIDYLVSKLE